MPSGIVSDKTTSQFFASIAETDRLLRLYDFENKKTFFPDVHASFKFCILNFAGSEPGRPRPRPGPGTARLAGPGETSGGADFVFFAHTVEDLEDKKRHIALTGDDIQLLNPNTRTCPIFRTRRDAEITKAIYRRVPVLIDHRRKKTGNAVGRQVQDDVPPDQRRRALPRGRDTGEAGLPTRRQPLAKPRKRFRGYGHLSAALRGEDGASGTTTAFSTPTSTAATG